MSKWSRLLDAYDEIECDPFWDYLRKPGIILVKGDNSETAETASVMVVGEAPGARENGAGRPFVGPSGRILDDLLGVAGLDRSKVFVTNVVKYRPPGNETPNLAAVLHAQEALRREFMIIRPKLTILVGAVAHGAMHPMRGLWNLGLAIQAGVMHYSGTDPYQYVVSEYHPQYGVRGGTKVQEKMERDWAALGEWIEESGV